MDGWNLERYRRPYLAAEVRGPAETADVTLSRGEAIRVIAFDDGDAADEAAHVLAGLRSPENGLWDQIRRGDAEPGWIELLHRIDEWSFVEDAAASDASAASAAEDGAILAAVEGALAYVRGAVAPPLMRAMADQIDALLAAPATDGSAASWSDDNFYRAVARLSLARLARANPVAHAAAMAMIEALRSGVDRADAGAMLGHVAGCYSIQQLRIHLSALADLLVRSLSDDARRLCEAVPGRATIISGTEFAHDAEAALRHYSVLAGEGRFVRALAGLRALDDPLAIGCHIEEYHVTRRFVEMITPLMSMDLSDPLRALVYRYFSEEVGHEAFERATCESLGVDGELLMAACPLPLHVIFVDLFTALASDDPLGFFAAVPITEGLLGESSLVNRRLDEITPPDESARSVFRRHEELNVALNHASIARLALDSFVAVRPAAQARALASLALLFELNFRAWEALADYYGPQAALRLPTAFDSALMSLGMPGPPSPSARM